MENLSARDLMTPDVVTVPLETPIVAIARLMAERGISAVPVLGEKGEVKGIVTEADLLRRLAGQVDKPPGWFASMFGDPVRQAERFARTHGVNAADVMTEELIYVTPETPAPQVAHLLEDRGIRRVLVMEEGRLRGVVSRADLLRALLTPTAGSVESDDERIRTAVLAAMRQQPWASTYQTMVDVKDGVVEFSGFVSSEGLQRGLRVLAENVPGVKAVHDRTQSMPMILYGGI